jgi:MOSC domain-containing protein YiiM
VLATTREMRVLSVNVGLPRKVQIGGRIVLTSIYKTPAHGRVAVRGYNLEGDRQADPRVHGGPYKAIYVYPSEHYAYWAEELPGADLPFGAFGENLTTAGLDEESAHIGDQFRIGSAILQVAQPRMPCFKLALRFNRPDMPKRFWNSGRFGIYFSVFREGELGSGDAIEQLAADPEQVSAADVVRLYKGDIIDGALVARALRAPLHGRWKYEIRSREAEAI